jgi:hypothetical protein
MRPRFILPLALMLLGSLSCSQGPSRLFGPRGVAPAPIDIALALATSAPGGSPAQPVTITVTVENLGRSVQTRCHVQLLHIYDVQGKEFFYWDPTHMPVGLCDPNFRSSERYVWPLTFDGNGFSSDGQPLLAPAGTYRAVAEFQYFGDSGLHALTREVTFTWQ